MKIATFSVVTVLAVAVVDAVTPVAKVTQLLEELASKVEQEGKDEATAYDKFACFCKEQADNKLYAIEKSTKKINHLSSKIEKLDTEITELDGEISGLGSRIETLDGELVSSKALRDSQHQAFLGQQADVDGAIDAIERALQALKQSKKSLTGKAEREALIQLTGVAQMVLRSGQQQFFKGDDVNTLQRLAAQGDPGTAYSYKYKSNSIIALLEKLRIQFKNQKATIEQDEFDANAAFELKYQDAENEKKFAEKDKLEKEAVRESKDSERSAATAEKTEEEVDKGSDQNFLRVLQADCEEKATLWDQRSSSRADELQAIGQAIESLKNGVAPNWKANKKLVGLQVHSAVGHKGANYPMLVQIESVSLRGSIHREARSLEQVSDQVHQILEEASRRLHSSTLGLLAMKVRVSEDHFVKVRQIIKDMINKLQDDALAESQRKAFCDEEMEKAVQRRDQEQSKFEDFSASISLKEAEKKQLKSEIAELSAQIADNQKALAEATQLRGEERLENENTESEAGVGKAAVEQALQLLQEYYQRGSFVQRTGYIPPDSDREGKTVADLRPEVFDSEYQGAQEASKGIIGMLQVILSDFDRTGDSVRAAEAAAVDKFTQFKTANEQDTQTKEESKAAKEGEVTVLEDDLVEFRGKADDAQTNHAASLDELEDLKKMCVAGEETYEEKVAKRKKEIEALKEAHSILEDWKK